jgi:FkbM family methyltransferase
VFNCALVGEAAAGDTIQLRYGDLMSVVADAPSSRAHAQRGAATAGERSYEVEVPARTLTSVIEEAGSGGIDLMVLDVEGGELEVLRGLDLDRFAPRLLVVEMLEMSSQRAAFDALLASRYESATPLTQWDALYVRRDR